MSVHDQSSREVPELLQQIRATTPEANAPAVVAFLDRDVQLIRDADAFWDRIQATSEQQALVSEYANRRERGAEAFGNARMATLVEGLCRRLLHDAPAIRCLVAHFDTTDGWETCHTH